MSVWTLVELNIPKNSWNLLGWGWVGVGGSWGGGSGRRGGGAFFILHLTNQLYLNDTHKIFSKSTEKIVAIGQLKSQIKQENLG